MASITPVKVRAEITIGALICETPFITSFNVTKARGQFSSFTASLKVFHSDVTGDIGGGNIVIKAGEGRANTVIFTGVVKRASISPCYDDPAYVILSLSGTDILSFLTGKKYSRRCRGTHSTWVSIQSVTRPGLKSSKFSYQPQDRHGTFAGAISEEGGHTVFNQESTTTTEYPAPVSDGGKQQTNPELTLGTSDTNT